MRTLAPLYRATNNNFWDVNYDLFDSYHPFRVNYEDGYVTIERDLPGVDKKDVTIDYHQDENLFRIFVGDRVGAGGKQKNIILTKKIVAEKIEAELSLGVLTIRAPIVNSSRRIQIK